MAAKKPLVANGGVAAEIGGADVLAPAALGSGAAATTFLAGDSTYRRQQPRIVAVTWASSLSLNLNDADVFDITLLGPTTLDFIGGSDGQTVRVRIRQDVVGGHVLTLGSNVRLSSDLPVVVLSTAAGALDYLAVSSTAIDNKYDLVSLNRGF